MASLDGLSAPASDGANAAQAAHALRDCLADAGLNAAVVNREDGQSQVAISDNHDGDDVVWVDFAVGVISMPAEKPQWLTQTELDALLDPDAASAALFVGGVDHTDAYVECRDDSDYKVPERESDPRQEAANKLGMIEATNEWIDCARENGFPEMADVAPLRIDDWSSLPTALLPTDIAESELRALLGNCPPFDLERQLEWDKASETDSNIPPLFFPNIGFDADGLNGDTSKSAVGEDVERLRELLTLVDEAQMAYWDSVD